MRRFFVLFAASMLLCSISNAQDQQSADQDQQTTPSLGELARQFKLRKQQKEAQLKPKETTSQEAQVSDATPPARAKAAHLVTNNDAPEHASGTTVSSHPDDAAKSDSTADSGDHEATDQSWTSKILAQKKTIADLEQDIKTVGNSIHYAGANCVANCDQWNERQQQKQQEVDTMKAQLDEAKKQLADMQESARK